MASFEEQIRNMERFAVHARLFVYLRAVNYRLVRLVAAETLHIGRMLESARVWEAREYSQDVPANGNEPYTITARNSELLRVLGKAVDLGVVEEIDYERLNEAIPATISFGHDYAYGAADSWKRLVSCAHYDNEKCWARHGIVPILVADTKNGITRSEPEALRMLAENERNCIPRALKELLPDAVSFREDQVENLFTRRRMFLHGLGISPVATRIQ
jgi:hypothetical protein